MANFQKIRVLCAKKDMPLSKLAEELKISPAGVQNIIVSNSTSTRTIEKIANILGVKVGVFFDESESEEQTPQDPNSIIAQKDAIIAQKDKIIEQKDEVIRILASRK